MGPGDPAGDHQIRCDRFTALPDLPIIEYVPYAESLRRADRPGRSVLDGMDDDLLGRFKNILSRMSESAATTS